MSDDLSITLTARHGIVDVTVRLEEPATHLADVIDALLTHVLPALGFGDVERQVAAMFRADP